jgi:hypothetical protein
MHPLHARSCSDLQIHGIMVVEKGPPLVDETRWKPKGNVDLKLGSKGFFTTMFNLTED